MGRTNKPAPEIEELLVQADGRLPDCYLSVDSLGDLPIVQLSSNRKSLVAQMSDDSELSQPLTKPRARSVDSSCLISFLALADSEEPLDFLAFATRWGLLGLCCHGEPAAGHGLRPRSTKASRSISGIIHGSAGEEEIADWRRHARSFGAALRLAKHLQESGTALHLTKAWQELGLQDAIPQLKSDAARQRRLVAGAVNRFISASMVQPLITWERRPTIAFGCRSSTSLYAALALQLAMLIANSKAVFCSYCQHAYVPKRKPSSGVVNSCPVCRSTKAVAARVQRHRDKVRRALKAAKRSK